MYRVVLDANQIVSAFINKIGHPAQILDLFRNDKFEDIISPSIITEVENVLNYPRLQKRHGKTKQEIRDFLSSFIILCINVDLDEKEGFIIPDDPSDDKYILCALNGNADFIITGDKHLLELSSYKNVRILTPREFLGIIKAQ